MLHLPDRFRRYAVRGAVASAFVVAGLAFSATSAFADSTGTPGQPSQSCQSFFGTTGPLTPKCLRNSGWA